MTNEFPEPSWAPGAGSGVPSKFRLRWYSSRFGSREAAITSLLVRAGRREAAVAPFSVDIYKNGLSIFTGTGPTINTGDLLSADVVPTTTAVLARDYFEVQITDAGGNYGRAMVYIVVT